jgi:hypothetical protein
MNRSMRKRSGAFLVVLSALVGIAQVASADHSELIAGANAKKEACGGYNSKEALYCAWACGRVSAELTRKPDMDTAEAEGLKAFCDATYEAVGFGTADAPVTPQQAAVASMPDVEGEFRKIRRGALSVRVEGREDWARYCKGVVRTKDGNNFGFGSRRESDVKRVRVIGITYNPNSVGRLGSCYADRVIFLGSE